MKNNRKPSPNRITCQISGETRMSNKTYIADKAYKHQTTSALWCSFYISKPEYKKLVQEVEENGLDKAAVNFQIDTGTMIKYLRYNGRGNFVERAVAA